MRDWIIYTLAEGEHFRCFRASYDEYLRLKERGTIVVEPSFIEPIERPFAFIAFAAHIDDFDAVLGERRTQ